MQIEINDEQVKEIVNSLIKDKVDAWFKDGKNKYIIRETVAQAVDTKLGTPEYSKILREEAENSAKNICTKDVVKQVCDRVSYDIAEAFAEKYGD